MAASHGKSWISSKTFKRSLADRKTPKNSGGSAPHGRSLFGRRIGRPLSAHKKDVLKRLLPTYEIPPETLVQPGTLNPENLFKKKYSEYWFEIGFGYGEHLTELSLRNPKTGYIGAEPFINGMAALLSDLDKTPAENIRVMMDDAMLLARALGKNTLDGIFILNPDPWHKTRHHKRRIVNRDNLDIFHRILKPGGRLIMTSDVEALSEWMVTHVASHPGFEWTAKNAKDWQEPPLGWSATRYETKRAKNAKKMCYLLFRKKGMKGSEKSP